MAAVDLSKEEATFLLGCIQYFRESPAYRERYTEMTFGLARKLAPIANGPDEPEGGSREPSGDSPDSPAPGEARLPGGSDDYLSIENRPDDSAGIEHVIPLTKISQFHVIRG